MARSPARPLPKDIADYFYYDETSSSCLRWKEVEIRRGKDANAVCVSPDDSAGYLTKAGYYVVRLRGVGYLVHRIVYALCYPNTVIEGLIFDHENGNSADNRVANLTLSTDSLNGKNRAKYGNNTTGVTGVHITEKSPGRWAYVATWREASQKSGTKSFSVTKYGEDEAFRLACEYRKQVMQRLIEEGNFYTERHGN